MEELYLGVEIGGTKQQLCVCGPDGGLHDIAEARLALPRGAQDILDWLRGAIPQLLAKHPGVRALGVGFGGPLETATGRVLTSVQVPGWKDFELKRWFEDSFGLPAVVVNDTVAGGYAELLLGSGRGARIFFYTNIGTGIGGALFAGGRNWDGVGYGAAYLGNTYAPDWTSATPGATARVESLCSGTAIEARLRADGYVPKDSRLRELCGGDTSRLDCRMLGEAARAGDPFALAELDRVGQSFGLAVANVVTMLGADVIAIGGGLANLGEPLLEPIREYAQRYVFISGKGKFRVVRCAMPRENVPVGAALYARDGFASINT